MDTDTGQIFYNDTMVPAEGDDAAHTHNGKQVIHRRKTVKTSDADGNITSTDTLIKVKKSAALKNQKR